MSNSASAELRTRRYPEWVSSLNKSGYHVLPDRVWPQSRTPKVDFIVVGPSGLFIVNTHPFAGARLQNGVVLRGDADLADRIARLADFAYATEAVVADAGLAPGEVHALAVLGEHPHVSATIGTVEVVGEYDVLNRITGRGARLTRDQVHSVLDAALDHFPTLGEIVAIEDDEGGYATGPVKMPQSGDLEVDGWMSYLSPAQARIVRRSFNGPSRIRGAAGTGKSAVALHRAAYLARSMPGAVLFTSFGATLPAVLSDRLKRMAPDVASRVEFIGTQAFAKRLLTERGIPHNPQPKIVDAEFDFAWRTIGMRGPLAKIDRDESYWRDEIDYVIKGRGITSFERYADLSRTGRGRPLTIEQRQAVWELYGDYEKRLDAKGAHDVADLITVALASLRERPLAGYSAVIVDEAQDLSAMMIRMLHELVGNARDGLTLVSDGMQAVYPGGYTLDEVDFSVAGRAVSLTTNYRNSAEIVEFASTLVDGEQFTDIQGEVQPADAVREVVRRGEEPVVERFTSRNDHDAALLARIRELARRPDTDLGSIGVLSLDPFGVTSALAVLRKANIPFVELQAYDGRHVNAVKVGTVKRAKGLEFDHVLLVQVKGSLLVSASSADAGVSERRQLQRRELYVATTRARDGLWVGVLG